MRKIGIMGGTFNPIHNGHLTIAEEARKQFLLDEVLFMPCGQPYMKADQIVESGQTRAAMTALAIQGNPYFTLCTMEIEQPGNTYTYQTLEKLKKENPDSEYYYIVGADTLFNMSKWRCPEHIFCNCCILAAIRDDKTTADMDCEIDLLKREYSADIRLLHPQLIDISSTDIRHKVSLGISIEEDVPEPVRRYIENRGLYR